MLMKIKEVIVLAYPSRTTITPILLTYENNSMYLYADSQGYTLFGEDSPEPFSRIQEPLLLAHGIMTDSKTVHLVILKTSGELCYTLISGTSTPQTTLIAKLDVRTTIYRRLFLFPHGKTIHIFYAYSHQSIRNLWRIEHRFWNGTSWHSAHMGEVVHQQEPLYQVNLDNQGNLHLLTITFQGRHSILFTNRFNGSFHIWGSPTETLKIPGEVVDMTALMTSDNVHHLFWVVKNINGQFEIRWAQQTDAHELASTWHPSPAPIKTFPSPWKSIGALEKNGVLWLLAHTEEEILIQNDGKGWRLISSHAPFYLSIQWVHKGKKNFHQTYWLEDQVERRFPAYYHELGYAKKHTPVLPEAAPNHFFPNQPLPSTPPPVPAFYPDLSSPTSYPVQPISFPENDSNSVSPADKIELEQIVNQDPTTAEAIKTLSPKAREVAENSLTETLQPQSLQENTEPERQVSTVEYLEQENSKLQSLVSTVEHLEQENSKLQSLVSIVDHLEQENSNMSLDFQNTLSKLDQILEAISDKALQPQKETDPLDESSEAVVAAIAETSYEELEPVKEAMANLEKETQSLSQVLRVMLTKQEENETSLENLVTQISQLQEERKDLKHKGGFWNKWIT